MTTPPDKTEELLQATNTLIQALENLKERLDQSDEARDERLVATDELVQALRNQVDAQGVVVDSLANVQETSVEGMNVLGKWMEDLNSRIDGFDGKLDGIRDDIALVRGGHARNAMRQNLPRIVEQFGFNLISSVPQETVIAFSKAAARQGVASGEAISFGNADMVINVLDAEGKPAYVALEASFTIDSNDVRRAVRNAGYLAEYTGLATYPAVAGVQVLPQAQEAIEAAKALLYEIPARELQSE